MMRWHSGFFQANLSFPLKCTFRLSKKGQFFQVIYDAWKYFQSFVIVLWHVCPFSESSFGNAGNIRDPFYSLFYNRFRPLSFKTREMSDFNYKHRRLREWPSAILKCWAYTISAAFFWKMLPFLSLPRKRGNFFERPLQFFIYLQFHPNFLAFFPLTQFFPFHFVDTKKCVWEREEGEARNFALGARKKLFLHNFFSFPHFLFLLWRAV